MPFVAGFRPSASGFKFSNNFPHVPLLTIDVGGLQIPIGDAHDGMCGGMVFAVRDYFEAGLLPPQMLDAPSSGTLFNYIVTRLIDSIEVPSGPAKYMFLMSPGLSDHETEFSKAGAAPHGRAWVMINEEWPKIKDDIDNGRLSPLGLVQYKSVSPFDLGEHHVVLVYGYELNGTQLTLHVYDPNQPEKLNQADSVTISLDIGDPEHTTPVSMPTNTTHTVNCFFVPHYDFATPPNGVQIVLKLDIPLAVVSGQSLTLTASFVDAGAHDTHAATWDWGDGTSQTDPIFPDGSGNPKRSIAATHVWHDSGFYTVQLTVEDQAGHSVSASVTVKVLNAAPQVGPILPSQPVDEGTEVTLHADFTDADFHDHHTASWIWGDGSETKDIGVSETGTDGTGTANGQHAWGEDGDYTVTVFVVDDKGRGGHTTATITVRNVPPTVGAITFTPAQPWPGQTVQVSAPFTDPGWLDEHSAAIDWGDGGLTSDPDLNEFHVKPRGEGTVSGDHHYAVPGVYTLVVTVSDEDGGTAQSATQVRVELSPDMPGMLKTDNENTFLTWVHSLPGALGAAKHEWRSNGGTPSLWWLYEADGWLYLFRKTPGDMPNYDPQQATVIDENFLALAVPMASFHGWFWGGGAPIGAWVAPRIVESRTHVFAVLTGLFG